jgi:hypothetical protein
MINTTIKYIVYNHSGGGVRHHHFGIQNNIIAEADGNASPGDSINALGFPSLNFNGATLPFAFMSVHGAADGNHLYTTPGNQTVPVGTNNIDILVVYAPVGGIGSGGGPGVWVDAFNVDTGNFSDSDFIRVLTPPTPPDSLDNPKTSHANLEGDVSSLTAENLRADAIVDAAPFLEWKRIIPVETIANIRDIALTQSETGEIWFAFYQTLPADVSILKVREQIAQSMGRWGDDDFCGTPYPHHIGPQGPYQFQIAIKGDAVKSLNPAQKAKLDGYVKEYPAIANAAYSGMVKVSAILDGVQRILSEAKGK